MAEERKWYCLSTEPVMFLFMCSSFFKFPVFNSLLYEKACHERYGMNATLCDNITAVHADLYLQGEQNRLFMFSSICLLVPSIFSTLLLGSLSDVWSIKFSMVIPYFGFIISNINYIIQAYFMELSVYWMLLSDVIFGVFGGFPAILGILFAYSVKISPKRYRSEKVALMEGAIGFGSMIGSIGSGFLRRRIGYTNIFVITTVLSIIGCIYILVLIKDLKPTALSDQVGLDGSIQVETLAESLQRRIREIGEVYSNPLRDPYAQRFLTLVILALIIEFISFAGLTDILFSYFRFRYKWTDYEYGWFSGISTGLSSLFIIFFYPILHKRFNQSNAVLAILGLLTKIANIVLLALASAGWLAMSSVIFLVFSRFVSTGLRSMTSFYVKNDEQGKIFSFIALLNAFAFFVASFIFNGLYPWTLTFFPGTMLIATAFALLIPVFILIYIERNPEEKRLRKLAAQHERSSCVNDNNVEID